MAFTPEDFGGGNDVFWTFIDSESGINATTQLWGGGRTVIIDQSIGITDNYGDGIDVRDSQTNTTISWTSFSDTSSQTTTTQTATVYTTTLSDATNVTTRSGTTVQTGTMTAPEPRTTITQTEGYTTKTHNLSTTRITTTTQQDSFAKWRTGEDGATHRGTFQSATVVCLETSNFGSLRPELAWIVTERPDFTATSTEAVQRQTTTQFTVLPSFVATAGRAEEATYDTDSLVFIISTSIEFINTPTTYRTTTQTANTITLALNFNAIPSPLSQQVGTTIGTKEWYSTIVETLYTGGDTSTTTIFSTTTHEGRIGSLTWNATHRRSTTALTSFEFSTYGSFELSYEGPIGDFEEFDGETGQSATTGVTFNRPISIVANTITQPFDQNQCGSSLSFAVAAASNLTSVAQEIGAEGITVKFPPLVDGARTARAPLGSWQYVTAGTSINASAGPASLSVTSAFGDPITTTSTAGAWTTAGAAVSRANLPFGQRINLGGVAPTGTATAFYDAGVYSTSDANGLGTVEVSEARTEIIDPQAARTAYLPATGVFIAGDQRYNTTRRNITQIIPETAIITDRAQLIL